jgi:hypothetical protein
MSKNKPNQQQPPEWIASLALQEAGAEAKYQIEQGPVTSTIYEGHAGRHFMWTVDRSNIANDRFIEFMGE